MPILGKYIVDMVENTLEQDIAKKWKWRPGVELEGTDPHPTPLLDLNDIPGWAVEQAKL